MKIKIILLVITCLLVCILTGCGYGYESTKEYELLTIRLYTEKSQSGIFTTKTDEKTKIEISYKTDNGIITETLSTNDIEVSEETKVIEKKGNVFPTICLTKDDYNELYGLSN